MFEIGFEIALLVIVVGMLVPETKQLGRSKSVVEFIYLRGE